MGDPKKSRRKYLTPSHPWEGERIKSEKELVHKYGLKNKTELWKAQTTLTGYRAQAKDLMARTRVADIQAQTETDLFKKKLIRLGLIVNESTINDILALNVEDILNRRLQTIVYHKGLAGTHKQARQFVTHGHISIGEGVVTIPSRMLTKKEEENVQYNQFSEIANELHPARPQEHVVAAPTEAPVEAEPKHEVKLSHKAKHTLDKVKAETPDEKEDIKPLGADEPPVEPVEEAPAEEKETPKAEAKPKKEAKAETPKADAKPKKEAKAEAKPKKEAKAEAPKDGGE